MCYKIRNSLHTSHSLVQSWETTCNLGCTRLQSLVTKYNLYIFIHHFHIYKHWPWGHIVLHCTCSPVKLHKTYPSIKIKGRCIYLTCMNILLEFNTAIGEIQKVPGSVSTHMLANEKRSLHKLQISKHTNTGIYQMQFFSFTQFVWRNCMHAIQQITWDKILAHSDIVDSSRLCDAASNRASNLFSNSEECTKQCNLIHITSSNNRTN